MVGWIAKGVRSLAGSAWIVTRQTARTAAALARGDTEAAGGHSRVGALHAIALAMKASTAAARPM